MGRIFSTGSIPKDIPTWQYNAFRQLAAAAGGANDGLAAIARGEAPDGSGSPLVDLSNYFYLPGRDVQQIAFGAAYASGKLVLSSTKSSTKGKIYLGSAQTQAAFDETNGFFGLGTTTPATILHVFKASGALARFEPTTFTVAGSTSSGSPTVTATVSGQFAPTGGPRVVPGMYITGPGIPAGTQVKNLATGSSLTMTANAGAGFGTGTLTFQTYVDVNLTNDETGYDISLTLKGGIRFVTGTQTTAPLRVVGDTESIAANVAASGRVYFEVGTISGGVATGTTLQIGGPGHGDLGNLFIRSSNIYIDEPNSGGQTNMGIGLNPAEFNASGGPNVNLALSLTATVGMTLVGSSSGTKVILSILPSAAISGTSPNKTLSQTNFIFKVTEEARTWIGNAAGSGSYLTANGTSLTITAGTAGLPLIAIQSGLTAWSDSAVSHNVQWGALTGTSAKRIVVTNAGNGVLDRYGVSSLYHLISNAQIANAGFKAPAASPEVLHVVNAATGGADGSVVAKIESTRTTQTADLISAVSAVTGAVTFSVDKKAMLIATILSSGFFADVTDPTKKIALDLSGITTASTRTIIVPDVSSTMVLLNSVNTFANTNKFPGGAFYLYAQADPTKQCQFILSGITTGNNRQLSIPDYNGILLAPATEGTSGYILKSAGAGAAPTWNNPARTRYVPLSTDLWSGTKTTTGATTGLYSNISCSGTANTYMVLFLTVPKDYVSGAVLTLMVEDVGGANTNAMVWHVYSSAMPNPATTGSGATGTAIADQQITTNMAGDGGTSTQYYEIAFSSALTGITAGQRIRIVVARLATDGSDTYTGATQFLGAELSYTADM